MDDYIQEFKSLFASWKKVNLDDPKEGLAIAQTAIAYADSLGKTLMASALGLLGSSLKCDGRFSEAESAFQKGLELLSEENRPERVDLLRRFSYLRAEQRRFEEAFTLLEEAGKLAVDLPLHIQATLLLAKGFLLGEMEKYQDALVVFSEALGKIDEKLDPTAGDVTLHNIIVAISLAECHDVSSLQDILRYLDAARRGYGRKGEIFRLKLKWAEALVYLKFGINNKALSTLTSVRRYFRRGKRPSIEFAMLSIDIAQSHLQSNSLEKCRKHLDQALAELESIEGISSKACEAVGGCIEAMRRNEFEIELLLSARRAFLKPRQEPAPSDLRTVQLAGD